MESRAMKPKAESLAEELAADLGKETESINSERKTRGEKPVEVEISTGRHGEYR